MIGLLILSLSLGVMLMTVGLDIEAENNNITVFATCASWSFRLYPLPEKVAKPQKSKKAPKEDETKVSGTDKKSKFGNLLTFDNLKKLLSAVFGAVKRFGHTLSIDLLAFHYTAAAPDVADAAIRYGRATAMLSAAYPLLDRSVRELDISTALDYAVAKPAVYVRIVLTVQIWELLHIALALVADILNLLYWDR